MRDIRLLSTPVIQVQVGTEETRTFYVHQGLLQFQSLFLLGLLRHRFRETEEGIIRLPEDDIQTFEAFVQWLYTGECDFSAISEADGMDLTLTVQRLQPITGGGSSRFPFLFERATHPAQLRAASPYII